MCVCVCACVYCLCVYMCVLSVCVHVCIMCLCVCMCASLSGLVCVEIKRCLNYVETEDAQQVKGTEKKH